MKSVPTLNSQVDPKVRDLFRNLRPLAFLLLACLGMWAVDPAVAVSIWPDTAVPGNVSATDTSAVEVGVKFKSDVAGTINGIRFYKAADNTNTHIGSLWTTNSTSLANVTFTNETAGGWQVALFATPVAINSNTVYVASYHAENGHYSADLNYFLTGVDNPPLHALADGVAGVNGIYAYGASSTFPDQSYQAANYWVDVVFQAGSAPTLSSIAVTPATSTISIEGSQQFMATGHYSDGTTQNLTSQVTWASSSSAVATIGEGGLAMGVSAGTATISAILTGVTGSATLTVQETMPTLVITTTSLPAGTVGVGYTATLIANGGISPYTWSISGSLPPGLMLDMYSGEIAGTPTTSGTFSFSVQVTDSSRPTSQTASKTLSITITSASTTVMSIWSSATTPSTVDGGLDNPVEVGVKFRSDVAGTITGIRFYKAEANTAPHVGNLWTIDGVLLTTVNFADETASGWQQALFTTPVAIASNTIYVASYHTTIGHYSADELYFQGKGMDNPPLHALADGVSGGNGVYGYGAASSVFPNQSWNTANYWVDVVFRPESTSGPILTSIAVTPANPNISAGSTQPFTAIASYSDGSTQNVTSQAAWTSSNTGVATINSGGLATGVSAGNTTISATLAGVVGSTTLTVGSSLLTITTTSLPNGVINAAYTGTLTTSGGTSPYLWSLVGGSLPSGLTLDAVNGVITGTPTAAGTFSFSIQVTDANSQSATKALSITIIMSTMRSIWSSTAMPVTVDNGSDSNAVEVGVKFKSDKAGTIAGIRFYKADANTGSHVGNLWTSNGVLLATANFVNETASGWQQTIFTTPVVISSNTVYVASYHAPNGHYSEDLNYFTTQGVDNPPLHALANGVAGGNGVYAYGSGSVFPNQAWNAANYWVDVVFQPVLISITVTPANSNIAAGASQQFMATGIYSDGSTQDITRQAAWASSSSAVATINAGGLATGVSDGSTTISATLAGVVGSTMLTVQPPPLAIATTSLPPGVINMVYTATLTANGGMKPYTWSVTSGTLPSGLTLNSGSGVISGTSGATGTFNFSVQVMDANNQTAVKTLSITITVTPTAMSIWSSAMTPSTVDGGADNPVEVGVKFRSDAAGTITGIRFYKAAANSTAHVGNLWLGTGTLLATVNFISETASGWQEALFATPVEIASNTVYVASYHTAIGHYSSDELYFQGKGMDSPPLHALADGVAGGNGVYAYGTSSVFPDQTWNTVNYWVDVVFQPRSPPTLTSIAVTPANWSTLIGTTQQFTAMGTYSDGSVRDVTGQTTWTSLNTGVATINAGGLATAISVGTTTISATLGSVVGATPFTVNAPLVITTTSFPAGVMNVAYTGTLMAVGGTLPYTWSVASGSFPPGLTLDPVKGVITGMPIAMGTFDFVIRVSDASNPALSTTQSLRMVIVQSISVMTISLPNGVINVAYTGTLTAIGGTLPYTWSIASGSLPPGLTLSGGSISGTPTTMGTFDFVVRVSDAANPPLSTTQSLRIVIVQPISITTLSLPNGVKNMAYTGTLTAAGGTSPYTWSIANGALPPGLTLSGGTIAGTPTTTGTFNFVAQVSDVGNPPLSTTQSLRIVIVEPISITTLALLDGVVNVAYTETLTAAGGTPSYTWSMADGSLPTGLTLDAVRGVIAGTTSVTGTFNFVVRVSDAGAPPLNATQSLRIVIVQPVSIPTLALPNGVINVAYTGTLTAAGGASPYTWSITNGSLPPGLTLDPAKGVITGTSGVTGKFDFVAQVSDAGNPKQTATKSLSITIAPPISITTLALPDGVINVAYTGTLTAAGGTLPYTWSLASGALPSGLTLDAVRGVITGTPSVTGTFDFVVQVSDAGAPPLSATQSLRIVIVQPLSIPTISLPNGVINMAYTGTLTAAGGTLPYTWSITNGSLPPGLTLDPAKGVITGTSGVTGKFDFVAQVSDAGNPKQIKTKSLSITIAPPISITTLALPDGVINVAYTGTLTAAGGTLPYTWSLVNGSLPTGLTLDAVRGVITGTPSVTGTFDFVVQVSDAGAPPLSATQSLRIVIVQPLSIPTISLSNGVINMAYTGTLTAAGGTLPYTWLLASGALPSGLTLDPVKGIITGTPGVTGKFDFVAQVSDAGNPKQIKTKSLSITIAPPISITTLSLPNGVINVAYTGTLAATGGKLPYTWSLVNGSLPPGLMLSGGIVTGKPTASGVFSFTAQVRDSGSPAQTATKPLSISVAMSIWSSATTPSKVDDGSKNATELGVKFRSDVNGTITGIRFYKASANTGTHVGNLWTSNGVPLATVTFSNETVSGWQQALFSTPMTIVSNTIYVASYHASNGHYSADAHYFKDKGVDNPPLHALRNGIFGGNGVYIETKQSAYPNKTREEANYWVDVVFVAGSSQAQTLTSIPLMADSASTREAAASAAGGNVEQWPSVWTSGDLSGEYGAFNLIDSDTSTMWIGNIGGEPWRMILDLGAVTDVTDIQVLFEDTGWINKQIIGSRDSEVWFDYLAETNEWVSLRYLYVNFWGDEHGAQPPAIREIIWRDR